MKKHSAIAVFVLLCMAAGMPVFAERFHPDNESEYFYVSISVEKVSPYRAGYVIQYRKGVTGQTAYAYLPAEWFSHSGGRGEVINLPRGNAWPSLAVFYKDGEFSHVKLYVHRWRGHETWGNIRQNINIDDRFEDVETLKLQF